MNKNHLITKKIIDEIIEKLTKIINVVIEIKISKIVIIQQLKLNFSTKCKKVVAHIQKMQRQY